jgi:hypothetical protein
VVVELKLLGPIKLYIGFGIVLLLIISFKGPPEHIAKLGLTIGVGGRGFTITLAVAGADVQPLLLVTVTV